MKKALRHFITVVLMAMPTVIVCTFVTLSFLSNVMSTGEASILGAILGIPAGFLGGMIFIERTF